ncbi:MAG: Isoleucyl-tRNA synthetase [Candidatus Shapirobacteria bacterium GW2011_GWF1_38_23]|nr:MAG: Isoleucyl-tRNA synthetase [Candidatus Shapirobacteria bacterium GW2011_GWF2_37_20]KKQ65251.1 MAG: Isoleucyl-tRNA synthetase [Candidatus Shapirobacteria bacterium GW2011_GWF1_38_23]
MPYFKELPNTPDFPQLEKDILTWWQDNNLVQKYLHKNDDSKEIFSFIDGPITANAPMGVHHARGRTLKDVFQRFKNAQGFSQRFQNGFDCQGLWVEVEVEKENGFNSKKDIQNFGLKNFTKACLARVDKFSKIQTEQSIRLGMFMDWENSYYTNSQTNNLYIWHFLKTVWQKGWLVQRKSATTWCPRCETGLSQHEQADGYQMDTDTSVFLKFKLSDRKNEYFLAWTTTPWTLAANVLLAINTKFEYVKAKYENQILYLAKESADRLGITDYKNIDPKTLLNLKYESLFDIPAQKGIKHYITQWDQVNPSEGTGVVHIAPGCGQEDFELGKKLNSDMLSPLTENGHFIENYGFLTGKYAHGVNDEVIKYLESNNSLFKTEAVTHRYPHCWRCKTKCLFRLENSWYINSDEIRPLLKEAAKKVDWHPKYTARRMQNWLDSMEDWMISRKRFYGLALPFYQCSCGELTVIGSKEELKEKAINPKLIDKLPSFHRPWIDEIEIKCPKCGKNVKRIPDVGDVWLDAGVVPFSTLKYLDDKTYWQKWFPAQMVLEMTEQIRLWFYSMLYFSVTFEGTAPYKSVVTYSEVRDQKGERMSKTKKNGIPFDEAVDKMGADPMRWLYCQQKAHASVNFGYNIADQVKRDFLLILWNSYRFFTQHANLENWQPPKNSSPSETKHPMDKWLLSRLHHTIELSTKNLEKYNTSKVTESIEKFVNDLSTWYIRRSRDRNDNFELLSLVFDNLFKLMAPVTPFLSETLYQNLNSQKSVHLEKWPLNDNSFIDEKLEKDMDLVRTLCQLAHAQRQVANIKIRQPLSNLDLHCPTELSPELLAIIGEEVNIKTVKITKITDTVKVILETTITPELAAEGEYRDLIRNIQVLRKNQGLLVQDRIKIRAPSWPKEFEKQILEKTLADSLEIGDILSLEKSS